MTLSRTPARRALPLFAALAVGAPVGAAGAAAPTGKVPRLVFPIVGPIAFQNDFGDPRWQGTHAGTDIMAPRRSIAVAAEPGKIGFWTSSAAAGCMLYLYGKSGTTYLYIHLNNDLTEKNDNRGTCVAGIAYAQGLRNGAIVEAGQPVGFVGNSGDADGADPHLHFEVHPNGGGAVNPYPYLKRAERLIFAVSRGTVTLTVDGVVDRAAPGKLTIGVTNLRAFPAGWAIQTLRRPLVVTLDATAQIDLGGGRIAGPEAASTLVGRTVLLLTAPRAGALAAAAARPGAYSAARVVLVPNGR